MNREINFRGKRVDNGEWVYGNLITSSNGYHFIDTNNELYEDETYMFRDNTDMIRVAVSKVIPETVGQYTGLKDYDQTNKIWEHDIVSNGIRNYVVKFLNGCFWMVNGNGLAVNRLIERVDEIKVLGNVHDNLGLIK